jgi:tetratricopeptide (TPR) repeat protein
MFRRLLHIILLGTLTANVLTAGNQEILLAEANKSYTDGKFVDAIKLYDSLITQGYKSDIIYFNLGNAYFKQKNIPAAILNYERAALLNPGDEDINFNLELAHTYTVDRIEPLPEFFMITFFRYLRSWMSTNGWAYTGILFLLFSLILAAIFWFTYNPLLKRLSFSFGILTVLITLLSFTFSIQQKKNILNHNFGILFPSVVAVKSSPGESGKDLFVLHSGTKVKILDSVSDWYEIRIADGNKGWVLKDTLEKI